LAVEELINWKWEIVEEARKVQKLFLNDEVGDVEEVKVLWILNLYLN